MNQNDVENYCNRLFTKQIFDITKDKKLKLKRPILLQKIRQHFGRVLASDLVPVQRLWIPFTPHVHQGEVCRLLQVF